MRERPGGGHKPGGICAAPISSPSPDEPLAGHLIAVTRTPEAGRELGGLLRARGAEVLSAPLIRFAPSGERAGLEAALRDLGEVSWLLLTSPQAVRALGEELTALGGSLQNLGAVKVVAVGRATARALQERGVTPAFLPSQATARALGPELPAAPGEVALHLTSPLSEDTLREALEARGVRYRRAELYRTEAAELAPGLLERLRRVSAVTLTSGSAARHLAALARPGFDPLALPVAVMGEQSAEGARAAGFRRIQVAREPSLAALVDAVEALVGESG